MDVKEKQSAATVGEPSHKKRRHRKKQLYNSILHQMEFYFSDSNLSKDRFLSQLIKGNPYVNLDVFLKFNKIRKLTTSVEDIQKAVKNSTLVELSEDKTSVCRKQPFKEKTNTDECTIYVERLKSDATHEWLNSVFSEFGKVGYVSIPKYKHSNAIKGFAFVEFDTEKEAENALSYFESIGCKMPSSTEPETLCSINTFEGNGQRVDAEEGSEVDNNLSNKDSDNVSVNPNSSLKRKLDECEDESIGHKKKKKGDKDRINNKTEDQESEEVGTKTATEGVSERDENENEKKKKLKKEQKKKNYFKELGLQVLSKREWKKMRNRYLDLQRKKMKEFKQHLNKAKFSQQNYDDRPKKSNENNRPTEPKDETAPKLEFVKGVIVRMRLPEPCADTKKFKSDIRSSAPGVKFVDVSASEEFYIRFDNNKSATDFCKQEISGKKEMLDGEEEEVYWDKIMKERDAKLKKVRKKQRGRDKLLKKASKTMATHIKFDDQ